MLAIHLVYDLRFTSKADIKALVVSNTTLRERYRCYRSKLDGAHFLVRPCDHVGPLETSLRDLMHNRETWFREVHSDDDLRTFLREQGQITSEPQLDVFLLDKSIVE